MGNLNSHHGSACDLHHFTTMYDSYLLENDKGYKQSKLSVSNYKEHHLTCILRSCEIKPIIKMLYFKSSNPHTTDF